MKPTAYSIEGSSGSVLIIVMILLALFALTAVALTTKTATESRIATNHKLSVQSLYAAEAGFNSVIGAYYGNPNHFTARSAAVDMGFQNSEPDNPNLGNHLAYWISEITYGAGSPPQSVDIETWGTVLGTNSRARVKVRLRRFIPVADPFQVGILTNGDLTIHGSPDIIGSLHANGNIQQTGSGTIDGNLTAHGTANVEASVTGDIESSAETIEVPMITRADFQDLQSRADVLLNDPAAGAQAGSDDATEIPEAAGNANNEADDISTKEPAVFDGSGDQQGRIIFCEGDLTINGSDISNATIVATGNITINGSTQPNGSTIDVAMMAGGDITINGSNTSYGVFWSNGGFVQNGDGQVCGTIVCQGDISRNGSFTFVYNGDIENENLPSAAPGYRLVSWKQQF